MAGVLLLLVGMRVQEDLFNGFNAYTGVSLASDELADGGDRGVELRRDAEHVQDGVGVGVVRLFDIHHFAHSEFYK